MKGKAQNINDDNERTSSEVRARGTFEKDFAFHQYFHIFSLSLSLSLSLFHTHTHARARARIHIGSSKKKKKRKMNKINTHYNGRSTLDEFLYTRMMKHKTCNRKKQKGMASKNNTEERKEEYSI